MSMALQHALALHAVRGACVDSGEWEPQAEEDVDQATAVFRDALASFGVDLTDRQARCALLAVHRLALEAVLKGWQWHTAVSLLAHIAADAEVQA